MQTGDRGEQVGTTRAEGYKVSVTSRPSPPQLPPSSVLPAPLADLNEKAPVSTTEISVITENSQRQPCTDNSVIIPHFTWKTETPIQQATRLDDAAKVHAGWVYPQTQAPIFCPPMPVGPFRSWMGDRVEEKNLPQGKKLQVPDSRNAQSYELCRGLPSLTVKEAELQVIFRNSGRNPVLKCSRMRRGGRVLWGRVEVPVHVTGGDRVGVGDADFAG